MASADEDGSSRRPSRSEVVVDVVSDLVVDARGVVAPISKSAAKELHRLEKRLVAARSVESKRVRQLARAQASKGRKAVAKRSRQAAKAATEVASLAARLAEAGKRVEGAGSDGALVEGFLALYKRLVE